MSAIKFRMAARCEAAGRSENEDNFQLSDNLNNNCWGFFGDKEITLGKQGALIVVCDGMGGMNAGEVASEVAVKTIKEQFACENLKTVITSSAAIKKHIEKSIVNADATIKKESKADPQKAGMGSTIVLAWLINDKVYIGWCGDSRAYRYNPIDGLIQLSKDHSYVQELVDAGKLDKELAFDHPHSNIITRSLGDPNNAAKPDVEEFEIRNGDIFMLCSDGLSGVLRDNEIETVIKNNSQTMTECRDALWETSKNVGWNDNVTIGLCQVVDGAAKAVATQSEGTKKTTGKKLIVAFTAVIVILLGIILFLIRDKIFPPKNNDKETVNTLLLKYENSYITDQLTIDWRQNDSVNIINLLNEISDTTYKHRFIKISEKINPQTPEKETIQDDQTGKNNGEIKNVTELKPVETEKPADALNSGNMTINHKIDVSQLKIMFIVTKADYYSWQMADEINNYCEKNLKDYEINKISGSDIVTQNQGRFEKGNETNVKLKPEALNSTIEVFIKNIKKKKGIPFNLENTEQGQGEQPQTPENGDKKTESESENNNNNPQK